MSGASSVRRRGKAIHAQPDPEARPEQVPEPWAGLDWRPLSPWRNRAKARLYVAEDGGRKLVCKDGSLALRLPLVRGFRRWSLRNEARALAALEGLEGVPHLVGQWNSGLIMEFVPGRLLTHWPRGGVPTVAFDRLDALVLAIHARRVLITDLHRRNILVTEDGRVSVIDFELALDSRRWPGRWLRRRIELLDLLAAARQRRLHGAPLGPEHRRLLEHQPVTYSSFRRIKRWIRKLRPSRRPPKG